MYDEGKVVSDLEKEIEEMEKALFTEAEDEGHPQEEESEESEGTATTDFEDTLNTEAPSFEEEVGVATEEKRTKKTRVSWKNRYRDLQSYADSRDNEYKSRIQSTEEQNLILLKRLESLESKKESPVTEMSSYFTQEDKDMLGEDTVSSLSSATEKAIEERLAPLKSQLKSETTRRIKAEEKRLKDSRTSTYNEFLDELNSLVPDYKKYNADRGFNQWLALRAEGSKVSRSVLLRNAESAGDAERVSQFFDAYKKLTTNPNEEVLKAQVAPDSSSSPATTTDKRKKMWTRTEWEETYDKVRFMSRDKGSKLMEALDDALLDGRVR